MLSKLAISFLSLSQLLPTAAAPFQDHHRCNPSSDQLPLFFSTWRAESSDAICAALNYSLDECWRPSLRNRIKHSTDYEMFPEITDSPNMLLCIRVILYFVLLACVVESVTTSFRW